MEIDSIIFDLDGTLWDSTEIVAIAWNEVLKKHVHVKRNIDIEDLKGIMGLQIKDIGKKLFPELDENEQLMLVKKCCEDECKFIIDKGGFLFDGLERTLSYLSERYKLFIVSNCQQGYIEAFYKYHKVGKYFLDYENPGRTGLSKGENIKLIIERNKLHNPVYVGDTEGDLKASRDANIPFVFAEYGFGRVKEFDYSIKNFEELAVLF